jgi:hypothetical protein
LWIRVKTLQVLSVDDIINQVWGGGEVVCG